MSWSPELFIGELRPWPDTVHVVRGKTDEIRRYVPEVSLYSLQERATCNAWTIRRLKEENAKLRKLVCKLYHCQKHKECVDCPYVDDPSCFFEDELRELGIGVDE